MMRGTNMCGCIWAVWLVQLQDIALCWYLDMWLDLELSPSVQKVVRSSSEKNSARLHVRMLYEASECPSVQDGEG